MAVRKKYANKKRDTQEKRKSLLYDAKSFVMLRKRTIKDVPKNVYVYVLGFTIKAQRFSMLTCLWYNPILKFKVTVLLASFFFFEFALK